MKIWIDADACPKFVKDMVYKSSERTGVSVILVANSTMHIPHSSNVSLVVVDAGLDVADHHIRDECEVGDLVITADIPLAHSLVEKGVLAINPRGEVYTEENVGEALSMRNLLSEPREGGLVQGGPAPLGPKDRNKFASAFDRELTRLLKSSK